MEEPTKPKKKFDPEKLAITILLILIVAAIAYYIGFNVGLDKGLGR